MNLHFEVELGLVIGKTVRDFDARDTEKAIEAIDSMYFQINHTHLHAEQHTYSYQDVLSQIMMLMHS